MADAVEAVKVAVKVRPFNKREIDMSSTLIVEMVTDTGCFIYSV
jgi:hypothetical protein